MKDDLVIGIL